MKIHQIVKIVAATTFVKQINTALTDLYLIENIVI